MFKFPEEHESFSNILDFRDFETNIFQKNDVGGCENILSNSAVNKGAEVKINGRWLPNNPKIMQIEVSGIQSVEIGFD